MWRWATTYARVVLIEAWLADRAGEGQPGELDADGAVRPAMELLAKLDSQLLKASAALGLDPASRSRMGRDVAAGSVDMARLMAQLEDDVASDVLPVDCTDDDRVDGES